MNGILQILEVFAKSAHQQERDLLDKGRRAGTALLRILNGILDYSRLNDITLQAWSPFQKAFFDGVFLGDRENYAELNDVIDELAVAYDVPTAAIAAAWITRHPANMQVVLGTTKLERVREAALGSDLPLTRPEWYRLFTAAGHVLP